MWKKIQLVLNFNKTLNIHLKIYKISGEKSEIQILHKQIKPSFIYKINDKDFSNLHKHTDNKIFHNAVIR
jgi:hypothetical protein